MKISYKSIIALLVVFFSLQIANAKQPLANTKITLKCSGGKTYTATTDASGKFTISDYDCDGDYTFSAGNEVMSWSWGETQSGTFSSGKGGGAGKVNVQDLSMMKNREASSGQATGKRDVATGQATGKRQHSPVTVKHTLCSKKSKGGDCDDTDKCTIEITYDGNNIQGMAINEKGLPGEKGTTKKGNK